MQRQCIEEFRKTAPRMRLLQVIDNAVLKIFENHGFDITSKDYSKIYPNLNQDEKLVFDAYLFCYKKEDILISLNPDSNIGNEDFSKIEKILSRYADEEILSGYITIKNKYNF